MSDKSGLVVVDVQWDFIDGSLGAARRLEVVGPILEYAEQYDFVVASQDLHPANHCSFIAYGGPWKPHVIKGTRGAEIVPSIFKAVDRLVMKGTRRDTDAYSAFDGKSFDGVSLDQMLKRRRIKRLGVAGLVTEYCVKATALDALSRGYDVELLWKACRGIGKNSSDEALAEMLAAGITVQST